MLFFQHPTLLFRVLTSDNNYWILKKDHYNIIFDKQYKPYIDYIDYKTNIYLDWLIQLHKYTPSEKINIVLLSAKNQTSNAIATLFPFHHIQIYPVGLLETTATPFWIDTALIHELNHIFQLHHSALPRFIRRVFHSPNGILFGIFLNPYPNTNMLPSLFLEGDAVLKESFIQKGGRLYSGTTRALVYSQIKKYQTNPKKFSSILLNSTLHPFSGIDKYAHGGYLFFFLAQKYSYDMTVDFFKKSARTHAFFPNIFADTTKKVLGVHIEDLLSEYMQYYKREASLQRTSSRAVLFKSHVCKEFSQSQDQVAFLTSDLKSAPTLRIYHPQTNQWTHHKTTLPIGKVFKIANQWYSRSSLLINPNTKVYSLFSDYRIPFSPFNSKYVEDIYENNILYVKTTNHLLGFPLYLNNQLYSYVHSNALFDRYGNIYFFKQEGSLRTLYKNKKSLFSYQGYYGHLTNIEDDGTIYFIASTPFGSSIFQYKDNQILRSAFSDTIIHATKINNEEFIACEITPDGYEYKFITKEILSEQPNLYQYGFNQNDSDSTTTTPKQIASTTDIQREIASLSPSDIHYKKYNPLTHIRYSGMEQSLGFDFQKIMIQWGPRIFFTDYLQKNSLGICC